MKILKLILTFCILLGAIVGVFFIIDDSGSEPFSQPGSDEYEKYRQRIINEWEQAGDWDEQLFREHCELINQLAGKFSNTDPLKELETNVVAELIKNKLFEAWASATCKKSTVDKYMKAVEAIKKQDPSAKDNSYVAEIASVYSVYSKAYNIAYGSVSLEPTYNGRTWNSFIEFQNGKIASRDAILRDATYQQYLSNITDLKNNLNNLSSKLSSAKVTFYEKLEKEILRYYMAISASSRTKEQLEALRDSRRNYEAEYKVSLSIDLCARKFNQDVKTNEQY